MNDWHDIFALSTSFLEVIVRGSVVYWFLWLTFRFVLRRDPGSLSVADVLVVVLIADAAQNAMAGENHSIFDGLLLISTIVFWNVLMDWLQYQFPALENFLSAPPLCLIRHGKLQMHNLRKQLLTQNDLESQLREKGIESVKDVKYAYMESDGTISAITYQNPTHISSSKRPPL